jgi:hypothetical protein
MPGLGSRPPTPPQPPPPEDWSAAWSFPVQTARKNDPRWSRPAQHPALRSADLYRVYSHAPAIPSGQVATRLNVGADEIVMQTWAAHYAKDENPLFAWAAYRESRSLGRPLPAFVLAYLDRVFAQLNALLDQEVTLTPSRIVECLELKRPGRRGGRGTMASRYRDVRLLWLAREWARSDPTRAGSKQSKTARMRRFARTHGVGLTTLLKAVKTYPPKDFAL